MEDTTTILNIIKSFLSVTSTFVFGVGLILLIAPDSYRKLEDVLNKEIGGIRKRIIPLIENTITDFHDWLMVKTNSVGVFCIILSIIFYLISIKVL